MGMAYADGLLLFFSHFSNHDALFFKKGELAWPRITALNAETGEVVWSRPLNYLRRPLIVGHKIIIELRACDLHTGQIIMRNHLIQHLAINFGAPGDMRDNKGTLWFGYANSLWAICTMQPNNTYLQPVTGRDLIYCLAQDRINIHIYLVG